MSTTRECIQAELDIASSSPTNLDSVGRLADRAIKGGLRFRCDPSGGIKVAEVPLPHLSDPEKGLKETLPYNHNLVYSYLDPLKGLRLYVGRRSVEEYSKLTHLGSGEPEELKEIISRIKYYFPEEYRVVLPWGGTLGIDLHALEEINNRIQAPDQKGMQLSKRRKSLFNDFCQAVFTPIEITK